MKLSGPEKLIIMMLSEIHKKLGINNEIDPDFMIKAISSGNTWGIDWQYPGFSDDEDVPSTVADEVADILTMWSAVEQYYAELSQADKDRIETAVPYHGKDPKFPGWDGNNESAYMGAARFMIDHLDRFAEFKGRAGLNSHTRSVPRYKAMVAVHEGILRAGTFQLDTDAIIAILNAR